MAKWTTNDDYRIPIENLTIVDLERAIKQVKALLKVVEANREWDLWTARKIRRKTHFLIALKNRMQELTFKKEAEKQAVIDSIPYLFDQDPFAGAY